jgi:hypothetical protein
MSPTTRPKGRRAQFVFATLVVAGALGAQAVIAGATSTASISVPGLPANAAAIPQADLTGVACSAAARCVAVGDYQARSGTLALILTKNTTWGSPRAAVLPADALPGSGAIFNAVACASWGNCVAVGQYETAAGFEGLINVERAGVWLRAVRAPLPADAVDSSVTTLNAISCTTTTACVAVGQYTNASGNQGLIVWEGAGKFNHALTAPLPSKARSSFVTQLSGVSCPAWGSCVAVGQYAAGASGRRAMVVKQEQGEWSSASTVTLPGDARSGTSSALMAVRCVSTSSCVAVGSYQGATRSEGLIVPESQGDWLQGVAAPTPPGVDAANASSQLVSVSCATASSCRAVGQLTIGQSDRGLVVNESKGVWGSPQLTPTAARAAAPYFERINAVSCAIGQCSLVGQFQAAVGQPAEIVSLS